jgi:hypothetical protein
MALAVLPAADTSVPAAPAAVPSLAFPSTPIYDVQSAVLSPMISSPTSSQSEEHVAISPLNGGCNWLMAVSDFSIRGGVNTTKYSITYDFGTTWQEAFLPVSGTGSSDLLTTSDGRSWMANSDPVVAFDKAGNAYIGSLAFNFDPTTGVSTNNGIYVAVAPAGSSASPLSLTSANVHPVVVNPDPATTNFEDKDWIAVDNSSSAFSGRVYVTWSHFFGNSDTIMIASSSNQGGTWTAPLRLSPVSQDGEVQGSQVGVGPDGTVYVLWDFTADTTGGHQHFFTRSSDGGSTWSTPTSITPVFNTLDTDNKSAFKSSYRKDSFPYLAVNPTPVSGHTYGEIYAVYPDQPGSNAEIKFIRSTDNGVTFSTPVRLNDVTTRQRLMPSITADPRNNLHVSWFDTRNGSTTQTYDIYAARGSLASGSLVWSTNNLRLTPSSITAPPAPQNKGFIGDYAAIASSTITDGSTLYGFAVPIWSGSGSTQILKAELLAYTSP